MKKLLAGVAALAISTSVFAAEGSGTGTINEVKSDVEKLTINHGPIPGVMEMGMTMDFDVMDPSMLEAVSKGDKVEFSVEEAAGGRFVITDISVIGKGSMASDGHDHTH